MLDKNIVGKINYKKVNKLDINEVFESRLKEKSFKVVEIDVKPCEISVLPNEHLISVNYDQKSLTLYDKDLNLVKTIDKINNQPLDSAYITTDGDNKIYITNFKAKSIIVTDLNFNQLKYLNTSYKPYGICWNNNGYLYVCGYDTRCIHKLNTELECIQSFKLTFEPWKIKILDSTVAIDCLSGSGLYFFDLETFNLKVKYSHGKCRHFTLGTMFYEFSVDTKKLYCYNNEGIILRDIDLDYFKEYFNHGLDGYTVLFKDFIVISIYSLGKFLKISF